MKKLLIIGVVLIGIALIDQISYAGARIDGSSCLERPLSKCYAGIGLKNLNQCYIACLNGNKSNEESCLTEHMFFVNAFKAAASAKRGHPLYDCYNGDSSNFARCYNDCVTSYAPSKGSCHYCSGFLRALK